MNNQKDNQKSTVNSYGHNDIYGYNSLVNIANYDFINKKTEKLVTALYMVTDCMDTDDALKGKLRLSGVELLSDMYKFSNLLPVDKRTHTGVLVNRINEIISFIEIASTIGFISEMNTSILKKEFGFLYKELKSYQMKDKHFTFTLDENIFRQTDGSTEGFTMQNKGRDLIKDKRTNFNNMSFINTKNTLNTKRTSNLISSPIEKQERSEKILSLIKDNKVTIGIAGISIKDISSSFTDCSEKTIQRELNTMVAKNQIKKIGEKRWSRYMVI